MGSIHLADYLLQRIGFMPETNFDHLPSSSPAAMENFSSLEYPQIHHDHHQQQLPFATSCSGYVSTISRDSLSPSGLHQHSPTLIPTSPPNTLESPKPIIKSSPTTSAQNPTRKCVTFSGSDLVHVTEHVTEEAPTDYDSDLFPRYSPGAAAPIDESPIDPEDNDFWFESSTDVEPRVPDGQGAVTPLGTVAPLSFVNDVFGRTTIFVTSGAFRPCTDSGKLGGKMVDGLSGPRGGRRTLSAGTLNGIQSNRTRVKVDFSQGVLDINHNPGQTAEVESKAVEDQRSTAAAAAAASSYNLNIAPLSKDSSKGIVMEEFPRRATLIKHKFCHKLSQYRRKLIIIAIVALVIVCLVLGLSLGLRH